MLYLSIVRKQTFSYKWCRKSSDAIVFLEVNAMCGLQVLAFCLILNLNEKWLTLSWFSVNLWSKFSFFCLQFTIWWEYLSFKGMDMDWLRSQMLIFISRKWALVVFILLATILFKIFFQDKYLTSHKLSLISSVIKSFMCRKPLLRARKLTFVTFPIHNW